ncbi:MAG: haloacid dehalogenase type II [Thermoplasmata archaeon]|nr:haloacid dehalogenase type II [Thermoplasmata archaeon]
MNESFNAFKSKIYMTFDCYGTLIDWESGILNMLFALLKRHNVEAEREQILSLYAKFESEAERGEYVKYKKILNQIMEMFFSEFQIKPNPGEDKWLVEAIKQFEPFPDTVDALQKLAQKYKLGVITNIDRDLFEFSAKKLKVNFTYILTSEDVGSYKPSKKVFTKMLNDLGTNPEKIVHVAQSIYHDILPVAGFGITTVHVNRCNLRNGYGATPRVIGRADIVVNDLRSLVEIIEAF